jgi:hypothetical protein
MQIVVIHGWPQNDPAVAQTVAEVLGLLVFEVRQRMVGDGPVVIAKFADPQAAESVRKRLEQGGVPVLLIDSDQRQNPFAVRLFAFTDTSLQIATAAGEVRAIPFARITHLLTATTVVVPAASGARVTERKFSLGKTVLAGGIPMTKKVQRQTTGSHEERDELLWLLVDRSPVLFRRGGLDYAGLGAAKQLTRELNFNRLKSELRGRAPHAVFDDRLLKRAGQVRLLGTSFDPDAYLDLAFEILARTL